MTPSIWRVETVDLATRDGRVGSISFGGSRNRRRGVHHDNCFLYLILLVRLRFSRLYPWTCFTFRCSLVPRIELRKARFALIPKLRKITHEERLGSHALLQIVSSRNMEAIFSRSFWTFATL